MDDAGLLLEIFDKFVNELKEKERKRQEDKARKDKERKEREKEEKIEGIKAGERGRTKKDGTGIDKAETYSFEEIKRSGSDRDKKHRKRHTSSFDDDAENEKDHSRSSYRHDSDHKKLKQSFDVIDGPA
ncbi:hypothetical protein P3L10_031643 [Capsicum annuum]